MLDVAFVQRGSHAATSNNVGAFIQMTMPKSSVPLKFPPLLARLRLSTWRGRCAWLGGMLVVGVFVCWVLARMTPAWYLPLDPANDEVIRTAGQAQNRLYFDLRTAMERVPLGEQRWTITQDEINSFLAVNTPGLSSTNGTHPSADPARNPISDPYVVFTKGQVSVCARITKLPSPDPQGGVASLTFAVGIVAGPDGKPRGQVKLAGAWAGKLPIPRGMLEDRLRALVPTIAEAARQTAQVQFGMRDMDRNGPIIEQFVRGVGAGLPFPLQFKMDNREFVVKELRVDDGSFTIVLAPTKPVAVAPRPASEPG
jgi:hypothetical protein